MTLATFGVIWWYFSEASKLLLLQVSGSSILRSMLIHNKNVYSVVTNNMFGLCCRIFAGAAALLCLTLHMHKAKKYSKSLTDLNRQYEAWEKPNISVLYRGTWGPDPPNMSCFMRLNPAEISVSQTSKGLELLGCRWQGWPKPAPLTVVVVSQADRARMQGSLACRVASLSPQECLSTDWLGRHTTICAHLCSVSNLFL